MVCSCGSTAASPRFEGHRGEHPADHRDAGVGRRRHLVGVVARLRIADDHAPGFPPVEQARGAPIAAVGPIGVLVAFGEVQVHHAESVGVQVVPPAGLADNVVRRRRHTKERPRNFGVVSQATERGDSRHAPCIAAGPRDGRRRRRVRPTRARSTALAGSRDDCRAIRCVPVRPRRCGVSGRSRDPRSRGRAGGATEHVEARRLRDEQLTPHPGPGGSQARVRGSDGRSRRGRHLGRGDRRTASRP